jgi:hypothetical protein
VKHRVALEISYCPRSGMIRGSAGGVTIELPHAMASRLWHTARSALHNRYGGSIGGDGQIGGFFDFTKKILHLCSKIAHSPLVRLVAGVVPGASSALAAVEVADNVVGVAAKAMAKKPAVHHVIHAAAHGDPHAKALLKSLSPAERKKVVEHSHLQEHTLQLAEDRRQLKELLIKGGLTPELIRALHAPKAIWR